MKDAENQPKSQREPGPAPQPEVREEDLQGFKFFKRIRAGQKTPRRAARLRGPSRPQALLRSRDCGIIALIYRHRWKVELFFRLLKCTFNCRHLLSDSFEGVSIQLYCALIATLLLVPQVREPAAEQARV